MLAVGTFRRSDAKQADSMEIEPAYLVLPLALHQGGLIRRRNSGEITRDFGFNGKTKWGAWNALPLFLPPKNHLRSETKKATTPQRVAYIKRNPIRF